MAHNKVLLHFLFNNYNEITFHFKYVFRFYSILSMYLGFTRF